MTVHTTFPSPGNTLLRGPSGSSKATKPENKQLFSVSAFDSTELKSPAGAAVTTSVNETSISGFLLRTNTEDGKGTTYLTPSPLPACLGRLLADAERGERERAKRPHS